MKLKKGKSLLIEKLEGFFVEQLMIYFYRLVKCDKAIESGKLIVE